MKEYDKETVNLECPGCGKPMEPTYYDLYSKREAKCRRCGSSYKFDSTAASRLKYSLQDMEKAEVKLDKAVEELVSSADTLIKQ